MHDVALVVFVRGANVGGHRTFRPSALARELAHLDCVNIGASGNFVIRKRVSQAALRGEFARRLPFEAAIMTCPAREIVALVRRDPFAGRRVAPGVVRFVSILPRAPRVTPALPVALPADGRWLVKVLGREGRFVFGLYRREMNVIRHLDSLDRIFGVPGTIRNWTTVNAIARVVRAGR